MENEIEQIMKPYFDIKEYMKNDPKSIENESSNIDQNLSKLREERLLVKKTLEARLDELRANAIADKKALELRLNNLKERKEREIEEFINGSKDAFYAGHVATIRKDLESAYKQKEEELEKQIADLEKVNADRQKDLEGQIRNLSRRSEEELDSMKQKEVVSSKTDFRSRAYIRKTVDIKEDIRKKLIAKQKEIEFAISKEKLNFDSIMLELSQFKYIYDENHTPINASEWKALYQKSSDSSDKMNNLKANLNKLKQYLSETELTEEEIKVVMTAIAPQEKEILQELEQQEKNEIVDNFTVPENSKTIEPIEPEKISNENEPTQDSQTIEGPIPQLRSFNYDAEDVAYNTDLVTEPDYVEKGNKIEVDTRADLVKLIYNDVMKTIESTDTITLHDSKGDLKETERYIGINNEIKGSVDVGSLALPNGEYVNSDDFEDALDKYINKSKGKTYVVKERNDKLRITNVERFKKALNGSSILHLGKKVASKLAIRGREQTTVTSKELGEVRGEAKQGQYISRNELIRNLNELFETKKVAWLKDLATKIKNSVIKAPIKESFKSSNRTFEDIYSNSDYIIDDDYVMRKK